jgi:hypothetical protein
MLIDVSSLAVRKRGREPRRCRPTESTMKNAH